MSELKYEFTKGEIKKLALAVVSSKTWDASNVNEAIDLYLKTVKQATLLNEEHIKYNQPIIVKKNKQNMENISKFFS